jgi:uncharacterized protein (DUF2225 family)
MGVPGQLHGKRGKNLGKLTRCPKCGATFKKAELKILSFKIVRKKCRNPNCNYTIFPIFESIK